MNIGCISGYFNPIHKGHIRYIEDAKSRCDFLIAIVNNDVQVGIKGSKPFMDEDERLEIVRAIRYVDLAVISCDPDGSQRKTLEMLRPAYFLNGGDRHSGNIPETDTCSKYGIEMIDGIGGSKIQSSSSLKELQAEAGSRSKR